MGVGAVCTQVKGEVRGTREEPEVVRPLSIIAGSEKRKEKEQTRRGSSPRPEEARQTLGPNGASPWALSGRLPTNATLAVQACLAGRVAGRRFVSRHISPPIRAAHWRLQKPVCSTWERVINGCMRNHHERVVPGALVGVNRATHLTAGQLSRYLDKCLTS